MNPLTRQLLGDRPNVHELPPTTRRHMESWLECHVCGADDLTADDFPRTKDGTLGRTCKRCRREQHRKSAQRLNALRRAATGVAQCLARAIARFQVWAIWTQYTDQLKLLRQVTDPSAYFDLHRSWNATRAELAAAERRLLELQR